MKENNSFIARCPYSIKKQFNMKAKNSLRRISAVCLYALSILICVSGCKEHVLNTYTPYETFEKSDDFKLTVNGERIFVAKEHCFGDRIFNTAQFSVFGESIIVIESKEKIAKYEIRPRHLNIEAKLEGNKLTFSLQHPQMLMVEIDHFEPLCLFQTPPEEKIPNKNDSNLRYFSKGVHEAGLIIPKSGQTIYLEHGALVKGRIYADGVKNVSIIGRGILDARGFTSKPKKICGIEFKNSKNILIDGIGLRSGEWWQTLFLLCNDVEVKNMNLMSFGVNNDGIDIDGVSNFKASNCFIGCGDDGFGWHAVDAEANGQPPTQNCLAENCVIYNTHAGNGLRVGASMETEVFEDITFKDITVLAYENVAIRSDHSDWAMVKNLTFENFYIESGDRPVEIKIDSTRYSNNSGYRNERGHINGLIFKNVSAPSGTYILSGSDSFHQIENVSIIDCTIGEKVLSDISEIQINQFVKNVRFN